MFKTQEAKMRRILGIIMNQCRWSGMPDKQSREIAEQIWDVVDRVDPIAWEHMLDDIKEVVESGN